MQSTYRQNGHQASIWRRRSRQVVMGGVSLGLMVSAHAAVTADARTLPRRVTPATTPVPVPTPLPARMWPVLPRLATATFADANGAGGPLDGATTGANNIPALVDLDGDGDLDAAFGTATGPITYFENTGTAMAPSFAERTGGDNPLDFSFWTFFPRTAPAFVDIDGDGDQDFFAGHSTGAILFLRNDGTAAAPSFTPVSGSDDPFDGVDVGSDAAPRFADLDDDGDLDAVVGDFDGGLHFFENTGDAQNPTFTERTGTANPFDGVDVGERATPAFVAFSGDDDLDVFVGTASGAVAFFENTGDAENPTFTERTGAANPLDEADRDAESNSAPAFADIDGDGDFDAFVGSYEAETFFFENAADNATPLLVSANPDPFAGVDPSADIANVPGFGFYLAAAFADLDGDGDFDAFVGGADGSVQFFENTGTAADPVLTARTGAANPLAGVEVEDRSKPTFVDIDGDGDLDAFVGIGEVLGPESGQVVFFENTGDAQNPSFTQQTGADNPLNNVAIVAASVPRFVDLDDDGDFDAVFGEKYGTLIYYRNDGDAQNPSFTQQTGAANPFDGFDVGLYSAPAFADCDDDGDFDVFVGARDGSIHFFENTGTAVAPGFTERTGADNPLDFVDLYDYASPTFVDIDGDGDEDVVAGNELSDHFFFFRNTTDTGLPVEMLSFRAEVVGGSSVLLHWATGSETENAGFEVEQHLAAADRWEAVAFVQGQGTTAVAHRYQAQLDDLAPGTYRFRIKQIDFGGAVFYSPEVAVTLVPMQVALEPAFPNPFRTTARFALTLPRTQHVRVAVYDPLGRRVALLHDGPLTADTPHPFSLDGTRLPAGLYLYEAVGPSFRVVETVLLVK